MSLTYDKRNESRKYDEINENVKLNQSGEEANVNIINQDENDLSFDELNFRQKAKRILRSHKFHMVFFLIIFFC